MIRETSERTGTALINKEEREELRRLTEKILISAERRRQSSDAKRSTGTCLLVAVVGGVLLPAWLLVAGWLWAK